EQLQAKISHFIAATTGIRPEVKLVAPKTIKRSEGKAKRVIDKRRM
ncbi:MAG TPA: phenylacetate--CoA ligase, partial [Verrucomicrobiota bacterium]|nr:phenylacetate--CoA ligase [Verrucomicrobiota bacterium]